MEKSNLRTKIEMKRNKFPLLNEKEKNNQASYFQGNAIYSRVEQSYKYLTIEL